jgi:hypothetical protein
MSVTNNPSLDETKIDLTVDGGIVVRHLGDMGIRTE